MTTAREVVDAARSEVGYTENPSGSNKTKFAAEAGHTNGAYWCATFTTAILKRCKVPIPPGAGTASTRLNLAAWKKAGRFVGPAEIRPGDVVFFHISGRNGNDHDTPDHTGFVIAAPRGGKEFSVEGNTSSGDGGSQDNGGGVYQRTRSLSYVIGAGRPDYANQEDDMFTDDDRELLKQIHATTAKSGYIEKIVNLLQDHVANPNTGGGPGQVDVEQFRKELDEIADQFTALKD